MNRLSTLILGFVAVSFLAACSNGDFENGDLVLTYEESEPGVDVYVARLLVNENFLRMDDGVDDSDYTLFDRQKKIIYSISHDDQTILKLKSKKSNNRLERKLIMDARRVNDTNMPAVAGKAPRHYQLLVNGKVCSDIIVVENLHKAAVTALNEFRRALVSTHLNNLVSTPKEMQDECFLAHNILSPSRTLQFGLPIFEESANGLKRILVDYKLDAKINASVYTLPEGYRYTNRGNN